VNVPVPTGLSAGRRVAGSTVGRTEDTSAVCTLDLNSNDIRHKVYRESSTMATDPLVALWRGLIGGSLG